MDRKRILIVVSILLVCLVGLVFVYNVEDDVSTGSSDVVASEEVELTVPQKILADAKKFEETGEGENLPAMVSALSDSEFEDACGNVPEECIKMCEGLDEWRCQFLCYEGYHVYDTCANWLAEEVEKNGFVETINNGYFSSNMFTFPETFERVGPGYYEDWIGESFVKNMKYWSESSYERWEVSKTSDVLGIAMRERDLKVGDIKEIYGAFEPFMDGKFLTDIVLLMENGDIYWMNTPIPEERETKDFMLVEIL